MSMVQGSGPVVTWQVLSAQPASGKDEVGAYGPGHLITARLGSGAVFQVFVPNADLANVERVRQIIAAKAEAVTAVLGLSSDR